MNELFSKMDELMKKQDDNEFEFFIQNNQALLKEDPVLFISKHVSYYAYQERVDKVLEVINYYKNAPYISMTVEDMLNELKENVEKLTKKHTRAYTKEEIEINLLSKKENLIASSLEYLSKVNIRMYIKPISKFLLEDIPYKFKTLALFILIEQHYENDIKVSKNGLIYTLNPSLLELPFDTYEYEECKRLIEVEDLDPQVKEYAVEILNISQIKEFPDSYLTMDNLKFMKDIFIYLANKMLSIESDIHTICEKHQISYDYCVELCEELTKIVSE